MEPQSDNLTKNDFEQCGWQEIVENSPQRECQVYSSLFGAKAKEAQDADDLKGHQVLALLRDVTSLRFDLDSSEGPFQPMAVLSNRRSAIIDDFENSHLDFLANIVNEITDAELRARVADILWLRKRDFRMGHHAVTAYLESAKLLEHPEHWVPTTERIERALQLGATLGKNGQPFADVITHIENVLDIHDGDDSLFLSAKLMELLQAHRVGDPTKNAKHAEKLARKGEANHNWHLAREYWRVKTKWHHIEGNEEEARKARILEAETYVHEAEDALQRKSPSYMTASVSIQSAIQALRQVGNMRKRINQLHELLLEYQEKSMSEMIPISSSINISDVTENTINEVKGKALFDALTSLAWLCSPPEVAHLKARVEESRKKYIFHRLFPRTYLNAMGKVIAQQPESEEEAIQADMFNHASYHRAIVVQAIVEPARQQIHLEHYARIGDFLPYLFNHPFVIPGREPIIARGLQAGLNGDFLTAVHFLIPQLEASVRYILSQIGIITSGLNDDWIQDEYNLNGMLSASEYSEPLIEILGTDFVFDLRGLLVERFGANLRNDMAHGLIDHNAFYSESACYLWWLTLKFYSPQLVAAFQKENRDGTESVEVVSE